VNKYEDHYYPGAVIWQQRMPGGPCILLEIHHNFATLESSRPDFHPIGWADHDFPIFVLWHPREGCITDPSYYYCEIGEVSSFKERMKEDAIRHEESMKQIPDVEINRGEK